MAFFIKGGVITADTSASRGNSAPTRGTTVQFEDFRINASVRTLLIRQGIDTTSLDYGTMNGIVYLRGSLRRELLRGNQKDEESPEESLRLLAVRLERQIRGVRGVRDVVCNLENVSKVRGQWTAKAATA